ncbi:unnamed protein product [Trichobilharzia regenti]|nr:unnamed protein product [Trichobilharzia regenti]
MNSKDDVNISVNGASDTDSTVIQFIDESIDPPPSSSSSSNSQKFEVSSKRKLQNAEFTENHCQIKRARVDTDVDNEHNNSSVLSPYEIIPTVNVDSDDDDLILIECE